jgi:arsenite/tail-anchored protein-transporting ATPase
VPDARVLLHTGKGGVGKSTVAAATAVAAARAGHRTVLLSTDPAHSAADVLDVPRTGPVPGLPNLTVAEVDTRARFEHAWSDVRGYLVRVLAAQGISEIAADELTVLPGAEEVVALLEVARVAGDPDVDVVVVDCAPTGETLRLLALPETLDFYLGRVLDGPARWLRTLATLSGRRDQATAPPRDLLRDMLSDLAALRTLLTDPQRCAVRLVLTPERVVVAETRRLRSAMALHGYPVDGIVVNRVLPADADGALLAGWVRSQHAALADIDEGFADLQRQRAGWQPAEPVGVPALQALARELFGAADPIAPRSVPPGIRVESMGEQRWSLRWPLPATAPDDVALGRIGDDLVVTVGPHRRRTTLPSVLRRCVTDGAGFEGDELVIGFRPDPALWPEALQPAAEAAR